MVVAETIVVQVKGEITNLQKGMKNATNSVNRFSKSVKSNLASATASFQSFGLGTQLSLAAAGAGVTAFLGSSIKAGLDFERKMKGFTALVGQDSDKLLTNLKIASAGTVSELELVSNTNKAIALGISKDILPELLEGSAKLGAAMGRTTTEAFEDITLGMGRQSKLILDNLGIIVSAEEAYDNYATTLGKTSKQLTDNERKMAFNAEVVKKLSELSARLPDISESNASAFERLNASIADFKVEIGTPLADNLATLITFFLDTKDVVDDTNNSFDDFIDKLSAPAFSNVVRGLASLKPQAMFGGFKSFFEETKETAQQKQADDFIRAFQPNFGMQSSMNQGLQQTSATDFLSKTVAGESELTSMSLEDLAQQAGQLDKELAKETETTGIINRAKADQIALIEDELKLRTQNNAILLRQANILRIAAQATNQFTNALGINRVKPALREGSIGDIFAARGELGTGATMLRGSTAEQREQGLSSARNEALRNKNMGVTVNVTTHEGTDASVQAR